MYLSLIENTAKSIERYAVGDDVLMRYKGQDEKYSQHEGMGHRDGYLVHYLL